uniref:Ubiquitously expressed prefoldin like chaperone n=1 Tax=Leptobrachium leishanense TaxID=445787 RepID=A0A8C5MLL5_9ANUR
PEPPAPAQPDVRTSSPRAAPRQNLRPPRSPTKVLENRDAVFEKISQYLQLKNVIERLQAPSETLETQVDLGCNFYVNAEVPDSSRIFVALGFGFFAELTLQEALKFIEKKNRMLTETHPDPAQDAQPIASSLRPNSLYSVWVPDLKSLYSVWLVRSVSV